MLCSASAPNPENALKKSYELADAVHSVASTAAETSVKICFELAVGCSSQSHDGWGLSAFGLGHQPTSHDASLLLCSGVVLLLKRNQNIKPPKPNAITAQLKLLLMGTKTVVKVHSTN